MLEVELQGDTLTGTVHEEEPNFQWHVPPYPSAMHKGATWPINHTRQ